MSAQPTSATKIANYTQAISANVTNLLTEVARASTSTQSTAPPRTTHNTNDQILRQLQSMTLEIAGIRADLDLIKTQMHFVSQEAPSNNTSAPNMVDLTELETKPLWDFSGTAEEYNKLARRYNSGLTCHSDFVAPLRNARNKHVFGFPTTVGDLAKLDCAAEELLCSAFGLTMGPDSLTKFCGFNIEMMTNIVLYDITGVSLAEFRVWHRHKRVTELKAAGPPTMSTRMAAAVHNRTARMHNSEADFGDYDIMPIHDERNLVVPGFPTEWQWFCNPHGGDVLYLLEEYGLDVDPKGCAKRFEDFVGVPSLLGSETPEEWFL